MPRIKWPIRATKTELMAGIEAWVSRRVDIPHAHLKYIQQLTVDDLTLLAMAMGYKPEAKIKENLANLFRWEHERREAERVKWDRQRLTPALPAPDEPSAPDEPLALPAPDKH